ncbi:MAG: HTH domain-containing protein [Planctomycetota bacterium]|nr:HTH domain-containing protein [Planctomycetota bacterium]
MSNAKNAISPKSASSSTKSTNAANLALNAPTSTTAARKRRAGRVALDSVPATHAIVAGNTATPKRKNQSKDNPSAGPKAARVTKRGAATSSAAAKRTAKLSALDAAALVLASLPKSHATTGISSSDLIERMRSDGLWQSPGGKTPEATLYAAMVREITAKGELSRFARIAKGRFALASGIATPAKGVAATSATRKLSRNAEQKGEAKSAAKHNTTPVAAPATMKASETLAAPVAKPTRKAGARG